MPVGFNVLSLKNFGVMSVNYLLYGKIDFENKVEEINLFKGTITELNKLEFKAFTKFSVSFFLKQIFFFEKKHLSWLKIFKIGITKKTL